MAGQPFEFETPRVVGVELRGRLAALGAGQGRHPGAAAAARRAQRPGAHLRVLRRGRGDARRHPAHDHLQHDRRDGRHDRPVPLRRAARATGWPTSSGRRDWIELAADEGATYDEHELIELDKLEPLIAKPSSPGNVVPVREVAGTPVAQVCFGSSVNSGYADLAIVGRRAARPDGLAPDLVMTVTPGSRQILDTIAQTGVLPRPGARRRADAGAGLRAVRRHGPGAALGRRLGAHLQPQLPRPQRHARTTRSTCAARPPRRPPPCAASSPIRATWALRSRRSRRRSSTRRSTTARSSPRSTRRGRARSSIPRGPNIQPPPPQAPLPETLAGRVLIVVGDDISTGDLSPDGAEVMAFRSNVAAMANYVFRRIDPRLCRRARVEWGGGFIVGGHNYGQGSSPRARGAGAQAARACRR